jgi:hypothetical protein
LEESLHEGDDIEGDLDAVFFNPIAPTISEWRIKHSLLRWVQLLNRLVDLDEILC